MKQFALENPWLTSVVIIFALMVADNWVCGLVNALVKK
jgi:hypothetical protein